ncbi:hypothetical protein DV736_g1879, partial [Chaetothyriales sp. CBS 134916]
MKALTIVASLSTLGVAQLLPISEIEALSSPPFESAPNGVGAGSESIPYDSQTVAHSTYADVYNSPGVSSASSKVKRFGRRTDVECSALTLGSGPVPDPDTKAAFLADADLSSAAGNAPTPNGWVNVFTNLQGATQSPMGYLGYDSLTSYNTGECAANCDAIDGCRAINIYFERDPVVIPGPDCPDPDSTTVIKCVYWGTTIGPDTATNAGQWQTDFEVAVAGSNGYVRQSTDDVPGYTGTFVNSGSINAPTDCNSYIQYELWNDGQPFDPNRCAAACAAVTQFNADYLCSRATCRFFDTYILLDNGVPLGQVSLTVATITPSSGPTHTLTPPTLAPTYATYHIAYHLDVDDELQYKFVDLAIYYNVFDPCGDYHYFIQQLLANNLCGYYQFLIQQPVNNSGSTYHFFIQQPDNYSGGPYYYLANNLSVYYHFLIQQPVNNSGSTYHFFIQQPDNYSGGPYYYVLFNQPDNSSCTYHFFIQDNNQQHIRLGLVADHQPIFKLVYLMQDFVKNACLTHYYPLYHFHVASAILVDYIHQVMHYKVFVKDDNDNFSSRQTADIRTRLEPMAARARSGFNDNQQDSVSNSYSQTVERLGMVINVNHTGHGSFLQEERG